MNEIKKWKITYAISIQRPVNGKEHSDDILFKIFIGAIKKFNIKNIRFYKVDFIYLFIYFYGIVCPFSKKYHLSLQYFAAWTVIE
jgi:hypothetical protein